VQEEDVVDELNWQSFADSRAEAMDDPRNHEASE
jgi:hypothetical protein